MGDSSVTDAGRNADGGHPLEGYECSHADGWSWQPAPSLPTPRSSGAAVVVDGTICRFAFATGLLGLALGCWGTEV